MRGNLPTVYDGIYRAAYSYGMSKGMTQQAGQAPRLRRRFPVPPETRPTASRSSSRSPTATTRCRTNSELLYVSATFGGNTRNLYRFQMEDGAFDYFDEDGRSAKQFLLRNPLPNGKFRSGFGGRRHPILGYSKMHTGVDWAAPTGSPIIAAGNGVVEKAGWAGGYGKQTIIRHANGYETSYNHQSRIGQGIKPGVRVRQGQVIGYVGTTGLSTGAHLHYELMVNNRKVDPMRVRLPVGKVLKGKELEAFKREKHPHRRASQGRRRRRAEGRERQRQARRLALPIALRALRRRPSPDSTGCFAPGNCHPGYDCRKRRERRGHPGDCREGGVAGGEPDGIEFGWKAGRFAETRHAGASRRAPRHSGTPRRLPSPRRRSARLCATTALLIPDAARCPCPRPPS